MSGSVRQPPAGSTVGHVVVSAVVATFAALMLLVLLAAWAPQLIDPLLARLGI